MKDRQVTAITIALVVILVGAMASPLTEFGRTLWFSQNVDSDLRKALTMPLRLELTNSNAIDEYLLGLRAFHYRAQPRGVAEYSDLYFDTKDWRLYENGYSYRYREALDSSGRIDYRIRLGKSPAFVPHSSKKKDQGEALSATLGSEIAQGAWKEALVKDNGVKATARLWDVLGELGIALEELEPRLAVDLRREKFNITDKGRDWFDLNHDYWTFRSFEGTNRRLQFEEIFIVTRLQEDDPELIRRVVTIQKLSQMIHGVRVANSLPHETAIEEMRNGALY